MIVSKPKTNTLISLGLFLTIAFSVIGITLKWILEQGSIVWYHYLVIIVLTPIALGVFLKTILGYKVVSIGKDQAKVDYPFRFSKLQYSFKDLKYWKETTIKTASGPFNQLEIHFENNKSIKLGKQENSNYVQVINYLKKKHIKKRATDES